MDEIGTGGGLHEDRWGSVRYSNAHVLSLICQVRYKVEFDENENDGMLDIFEVNVLKLIHEQRSHWRRFPTLYLPFIKCIIY